MGLDLHYNIQVCVKTKCGPCLSTVIHALHVMRGNQCQNYMMALRKSHAVVPLFLGLLSPAELSCVSGGRPVGNPPDH